MSISSRLAYVSIAVAGFLIAAMAVIYAGHCQAHYEYCSAHNVPLIVLRGIGFFIDDHNGVIIAFFTGTLWWSTDKLWKASAQQRIDAEVAKQEELRAYVFVFDVSAAEGSEAYDSAAYLTSYDVVVKNSGRTPAYNVTIVNEIVIAPTEESGIPFPEQRYSEDGSRAPLGPNSTVTNVVQLHKWTDAERALLRSGQVAHLHGIVRYEDSFGNEWWTKFRFARLSGHAFSACTHGNDAKRTKGKAT